MESYPFGYCTNVHAGATIELAQENLSRFSVPIREQLCPTAKLPIGLWLSEQAANSLSTDFRRLETFCEWLGSQGLESYTFNGFPQGDFHREVVKHAVYDPTWKTDARTHYTLQLADLMSKMIPEGATGSISTLPLGWPHTEWRLDDHQQCAKNLLLVANHLAQLRDKTGRNIVLAIEPEPGCVLNTAPEIVEFFQNHLFSGKDETTARQHLTVCHDICHSGVMFEPQKEALQQYLSAGIRIGKVQVSSAVHVAWDVHKNASEKQKCVLEQLRTFSEPKYLHQTTRCSSDGKLSELCNDLPEALEQWISPTAFPDSPWRIHFHVPIYVTEFDHLATTQADIREATIFLEQHRDQAIAGTPWFTGHYEVETYAWPVLPPLLAEANLAKGIERELLFFNELLQDAKQQVA